MGCCIKPKESFYRSKMGSTIYEDKDIKPHTPKTSTRLIKKLLLKSKSKANLINKFMN